MEAFLADRRGGPVHLRVPQRGEKRQLLELAQRNAAETLEREQVRWLADQGKTLGALTELGEALGLANPPMRIECYDISNFQGAQSVASMVVFEDGKPRTGDYRRFRIKSVEGANDFASHQEVLRRRFRRAAVAEEGSAEELRWRLPDLVIVDGGKGQVSAAAEVFAELGMEDVPLAGLAKEREELFLPGRSEPILLPPTSGALYLVQRLRDEAHRFAIGTHRVRRSMEMRKNPLDEIEGVGPGRKRALLHAFGSARGVSRASAADLAKVEGVSAPLAQRIHDYFRKA
jgi:excinuclease ABC subunit C